MFIRVTNLKTGSHRTFNGVDKVIFHSGQNTTEYTRVNCINHSEPATGFSIITSHSETSFLTDTWTITKASQ